MSGAPNCAVCLNRFLGVCLPATPDRLIKWFIGFVVIAVGVNLLSSFFVAQKWAWLPPAVFVAALLVACRVLVFCGGSVIAQRGLGPWLCSR